MEFLEEFIKNLLHTDEVRGNKLMDVGDICAVHPTEVYYPNRELDYNTDTKNYKLPSRSKKKPNMAIRLFAPNGEHSRTMLQVIKSRRGKPSNKTILRDSATLKVAVDNPLLEKWDWASLDKDGSSVKNPTELDSYIAAVYNALDLNGNNPLFLGVGNLTWDVAVGDKLKTINSPLLIFPIRFIRGAATSPVEIEFVDDDAYFNPCLISRMKDEVGESISVNFPHPNGIGADFDDAIDLDKLGDGAEYMEKVEEYINSLRPETNESTLSFDRDVLVVSEYNHSDICMYYDVKRNKQKIYNSPLVQRIFSRAGTLPEVDGSDIAIRPVLPIDSVQEKIIADIAAGKSLIIKGPPGTGKTLTIANLVSTLLSRGKSVLVASQKLAALAEVYAKLPEKLRKFVMLLDYETEQKAAAVNPAEVRAEFKRLIKYKQEYVYDSATDIRYQRADRARSDAMIELSKYFSDVFGGDVAWGSYYDALNTYFKDDLPVIPFADSADAAKISHEDYNKLLLGVKDAASHYAHMTPEGGKVYYSPWFGAHEGVDIESALKSVTEIAGDMQSIDGLLSSARLAYPSLPWDDITYGDIYDAAQPNIISSVDIRKLLGGLSEADGEALEELIDKYETEKANVTNEKIKSKSHIESKIVERASKLAELGELRYSVVKKIADSSSIFLRDGEPLSDKMAEKFIEIVGNIAALADERDALKAEVMFVFDKAEFNDPAIIKACEALEAYADGKKQSIGVFDLKAKSAEKRLRALCSMNDLSLTELAKTAGAYIRINKCGEDIKAQGFVLAHVIGRDRLTDAEFDSIFLVAKCAKSANTEMAELVRRCVTAAEIIGELSAYIETPSDYAIDELIFAVRFAAVQDELNNAVSMLCKRTEIDLAEQDALSNQANSIAALLRIGYSPYFMGNVDSVIAFVEQMQRIGSKLTHAVFEVTQKLKAFGKNHFVSTYSRMPWRVPLSRARVYAQQSHDRSVINAALGYDSVVHGNTPLPLYPFFAPIELGNVAVEPDRFTDLFVHSYFALVIENKLLSLGSRRNGLSKNAELALKSFADAENEIQACNVIKTENLCMARIDAKDDDFDFLAIDKGIATSLRVLFRQHAEAILKLKKCFIMSPSTASVLFRSAAYENFDVVIVDEASQMEPVDMLPVLFRSKQCVLVGDEFQMPPLTHFKAKNRKRISDPESELTLDTDISALSLALGNLAFDAEELVCHYRSKTETLIDFSQREFYPYMRTFPATVPATADLGFTDILTEDGYSEEGVNPVEANMIVQQLNEHFDRYYNPNKGTLSMSVGVVTFGEAQLKYVENLVNNDVKLQRKIDDVFAHFNDVPDKMVFFRTIETVQGQETDHLILSLTYGKDKNGKVKLAFGELNRDATGKNIFNVAVTRARSRITVIHSVTASQLLGNPRIAFIQKYLAGVERFQASGKAQFVSTPPAKGEHFVNTVANYIESLGIAKERIVINYGVTDGSVRIPIAILSKDLNKAELGIWCEYPVLKKYDFFDYNVRYVASLIGRGWKLHKVYAHDFFDNVEAEKAALKAAIDKYVAK